MSVIIAELNEQKRIADVVRYALSDPATAEVIVVDDSSTDNTVALARKAGARVITSSLLAQATGQINELGKHLDGSNPDVLTRSASIAQIFRFVHRQKFESVAKDMPIRPGVIECVKAFKRAGFMVGIVSDSYFVAADILRKRIFADFALAHTLQFQGDVCTGELNINSAFMPDPDATTPASHLNGISKQHVLSLFRHDIIQPRFEEIWAVGDNENDIEMLRLADRAWMIEPKSPRMKTMAGVEEISHFDELTAALAASEPQAELAVAPETTPVTAGSAAQV